MNSAARKMKDRARRYLQMSLGLTLERLIDVAAEIKPSDPAYAFEPLWFRLLSAENLALEQRHPLAPRGAKLFAWTGGDGNCFGFLDCNDAAIADKLPIVKVYGCDDPSSYEVVASDLAGLLSLLTVGFGDFVTRAATDTQWKVCRAERFAELPSVLRRMEELSQRLLTIPGVSRPRSPAAVANSEPNRRFDTPN